MPPIKLIAFLLLFLPNANVLLRVGKCMSWLDYWFYYTRLCWSLLEKFFHEFTTEFMNTILQFYQIIGFFFRQITLIIDYLLKCNCYCFHK